MKKRDQSTCSKSLRFRPRGEAVVDWFESHIVAGRLGRSRECSSYGLEGQERRVVLQKTTKRSSLGSARRAAGGFGRRDISPKSFLLSLKPSQTQHPNLEIFPID